MVRFTKFHPRRFAAAGAVTLALTACHVTVTTGNPAGSPQAATPAPPPPPPAQGQTRHHGAPAAPRPGTPRAKAPSAAPPGSEAPPQQQRRAAVAPSPGRTAKKSPPDASTDRQRAASRPEAALGTKEGSPPRSSDTESGGKPTAGKKEADNAKRGDEKKGLAAETDIVTSKKEFEAAPDEGKTKKKRVRKDTVAGD